MLLAFSRIPDKMIFVCVCFWRNQRIKFGKERPFTNGRWKRIIKRRGGTTKDPPGSNVAAQ